MKNTLLIILMSSLLSLNSWANDADCSVLNGMDGLKACLELLHLIPKGPNEECVTCKALKAQQQPVAPPLPQLEPICKERYDKMFADGVVNTTIAIGYDDNGGTTSDNVWGEFHQNTILTRLTGACPTSYALGKIDGRADEDVTLASLQAERDKGCGKTVQFKQVCGFKSTDDPEIYTKTIKDHRNRNVQIRVRIVSAQLSPSDKKNRESTNLFVDKICKGKVGLELSECRKQNLALAFPKTGLENKCTPQDRFYFQPCKTKYLKDTFSGSIKNGDEIVMYVGHARDGGGPSFEPPKVLANGHVNYPWYRSNRPGHNLEVAALKEATAKGKAPVFYGSFSCNSKRNFMDKGQLAQASPSSSLILSNRIAFNDEVVGGMLQTLDSAMSHQCQSEMNKKTQEASCAFSVHRF
ncbi:MAG: hypothetical protein K2P81_14305 [Bacteriovoracaceae bacterium]|nr:hypothetical protein [Bacteriovoracaceae bacterium]